jgi:ketopantoate reductase
MPPDWPLAGVDVRLLARSKRLTALREHGVILQDCAPTGKA